MILVVTLHGVQGKTSFHSTMTLTLTSTLYVFFLYIFTLEFHDHYETLDILAQVSVDKENETICVLTKQIVITPQWCECTFFLVTMKTFSKNENVVVFAHF